MLHVWMMYLYCAFSKVCEPCMYDACIYHLRPLTLVHVRFMRICMMHVHLWSWSLILMHACKYDVCIYDAANFVPDEPTNEQGDSRSRIWIQLSCFMRPFCLNVLFLPFVPFVVLSWSFSWFIMTVKTCFQIIQAEMRLENCPNLNRKFVIRASKVIQPKMSGSHNFPSGFHHPDAGLGPWPAAHNDGEAHLAPHWQLLSYAGLANVNQGREIYSIWLFDLSRIKSVLISQMFNMVESAFLSLQGFFVSLIFCYLNRWVITTAKIQWVWQASCITLHIFISLHLYLKGSFIMYTIRLMHG